MPSNHLILCRPLLLLPSILPSIRVFSNETVLRIRWAKYWSFSFSISPSSEYSELIPFRIDWLDLLAVQGTLKSLLQHHCSTISILQHSISLHWSLSKAFLSLLAILWNSAFKWVYLSPAQTIFKISVCGRTLLTALKKLLLGVELCPPKNMLWL